MSTSRVPIAVLLCTWVLTACSGVADHPPAAAVAPPPPTTSAPIVPTTAATELPGAMFEDGPATLEVPSAYATVQAAADAASPGDVVVVTAGTSIPSLEITTPGVLIRSAADPTPMAAGDFLTPRFRVEVERGVEFAQAVIGGGTKDLRLDVYRPADDSTFDRPVLVGIHGGGFVTGSRSDLVVSAVCRSLASRGQVCVSIDYRLVPDDPPGTGPPIVRAIDAAVEDAVAAVAWVRANAGELGVDPDRLSVGGSSAGAITALLVGFTTDGVPVRRVVDLWGGMYEEVGQVTAGGPPVMIVHGTADETVRFDLAVELMDALSTAGVPFEAYAFPGAGHGIGAGKTFVDEPMLDILAAFLGS